MWMETMKNKYVITSLILLFFSSCMEEKKLIIVDYVIQENNLVYTLKNRSNKVIFVAKRNYCSARGDSIICQPVPHPQDHGYNVKYYDFIAPEFIEINPKSSYTDTLLKISWAESGYFLRVYDKKYDAPSFGTEDFSKRDIFIEFDEKHSQFYEMEKSY